MIKKYPGIVLATIFIATVISCGCIQETGIGHGNETFTDSPDESAGENPTDASTESGNSTFTNSSNEITGETPTVTGTEDYVGKFIESSSFTVTEQDVELVNIALEDEEVSGIVFNYSFEAETCVSEIIPEGQDPQDLYIVTFWLFNGTISPKGEYDGIYAVYINESKQVYQHNWDFLPPYPPDLFAEILRNITRRSVYTYNKI